MFTQGKKEQALFDSLCEDYYEKVLNYLFRVLGEETAARDCTQDVFLIVCQKCSLLQRHPNPGGFIFQTAKNLAKKSRRESFQRMLSDKAIDGPDNEPVDENSAIDVVLDRQINEQDYIEAVLSQLSTEKRGLYSLYYSSGKSMSEIAAMFAVEEPAMRMRFVRLRREIRAIASRVADEHFIF